MKWSLFYLGIHINNCVFIQCFRLILFSQTGIIRGLYIRSRNTVKYQNIFSLQLAFLSSRKQSNSLFWLSIFMANTLYGHVYVEKRTAEVNYTSVKTWMLTVSNSTQCCKYWLNLVWSNDIHTCKHAFSFGGDGKKHFGSVTISEMIIYHGVFSI